MQVKTRFAPSSTGYLHIGSVRTALYSWLFAKHYGGSFVLRIEDTDMHRSKNIFVKDILKTLKWLGILWDEGPFFQSERLSLYNDKITELLDLGYAYRCYCSVERLKNIRLEQIKNGEKPCYDRKCRNKINVNCRSQDYVIRFKNPVFGQVKFHDQIRGKIVFNNTELDDLVIQRKNRIPTYNFCVVVDDAEMNITHVIRGEDHINNTPRQINILKALNAVIPNYAHVSMVVNANKSNLSKRKNDFNVLYYKQEGFLKEAILNYLIKLGWSYSDQEIFSITEMKKLFSIQKVSISSSELNFEKLLWYNRYYLNNLPINNYLIDEFKHHLNMINVNFSYGPDLCRIIQLLRNRYSTIKELAVNARYFFEEVYDLNVNLIKKYVFKNCAIVFSLILKKMKLINIWEEKNILKELKDISYKYNVSFQSLCMLLRILIIGLDHSPSIFSIMEIIGKEKILYRIQKNLHYIHLQ
ncbi:glutamate--tRNA ligase [Buchnera aphidicola]|uniref:glutamate--tRNA ligase n=1 Tax=Buchnera aphidicola TaxID=9 RepID=UPI0031B863A6